jgi:hypothetical protein
MEIDLTNPFGSNDDGDDKPDLSVDPSWWQLVGGVWRRMNNPLPSA